MRLKSYLMKCACERCDCPSATTEGVCYECERGLHVTGWIDGEPTREEILKQEEKEKAGDP